jgi:hypothetical protein
VFKSPTVLIVGAGASAEVGLPVGRTLRDRMRTLLAFTYREGVVSGDQAMTGAYRAFRGSGLLQHPQNLYEVSRELSDALLFAPSIDDLLEANAGDLAFELCGKIAIARAILQAERSSALWGEERANVAAEGVRKSWLPLLAEQMFTGTKRSDPAAAFANVSFVVFNYDRCLEHFLVTAVEHYYRTTPAIAQQVLNEARILHPYGTVGRLPWQQGLGPATEFGSEDLGQDRLLNVARQIRTYSEQVSDKTTIDKMRNLVGNAASLVFLGLSFGEQNLKLLRDPATKREPTVLQRLFATTLGISGTEQVLVGKMLAKRFARSSTFPVSLHHDTCAQLFNEFPRSITQ